MRVFYSVDGDMLELIGLRGTGGGLSCLEYLGVSRAAAEISSDGSFHVLRGRGRVAVQQCL